MFGTSRYVVAPFHVTSAPTLTVYVPGCVNVYSRNGSLVCALPGSAELEQFTLLAPAGVAPMLSLHVAVASTVWPSGPISWNSGCAVKPRLSSTEKYGAAHGKSETIHCQPGRTTGTWTLETTSLALSMSMTPLTPLLPRVIENENGSVFPLVWSSIVIWSPVRVSTRFASCVAPLYASWRPCATSSSVSPDWTMYVYGIPSTVRIQCSFVVGATVPSSVAIAVS